MLIFIIPILIGIIAGTFTGLTPGIHTNLIAIFALSLTSYFPSLAPQIIVAFIASMAITHTFIDFIPSIYLGAPDEDTALSTMPGHNFLLKGKAHQAVLLTLVGSALSIVLLMIIVPVFFLIMPKIYGFIEKMMSFILIWISIFLIAKSKSKIWAIIIFLLAGFLGIASLNLPISQPLLPLLTGLFGSSTLIFSMFQKTKIPEQKIEKLNLGKRKIIKPAIATAIISPICSFLPGLGSSQAAIIATSLIKLSKKQFLILLGSINTLVLSISFLTLFLIQKSRTGTASAISQLTSVSVSTLLIILVSIIIASLFSIFLTINLSKIFAKNIHKINYSKVSFAVLIIIIIVCLIFSGFTGLLVLIVSTFLGLLCHYVGIRKGFLMGSLLIPTILLYLPI